MMARCWGKTAGFVVLFGFAVHCAMAKSRCGRLEMAWFISMLHTILVVWSGVGGATDALRGGVGFPHLTEAVLFDRWLRFGGNI